MKNLQNNNTQIWASYLTSQSKFLHPYIMGTVPHSSVEGIMYINCLAWELAYLKRSLYIISNIVTAAENGNWFNFSEEQFGNRYQKPEKWHIPFNNPPPRDLS